MPKNRAFTIDDLRTAVRLRRANLRLSEASELTGVPLKTLHRYSKDSFWNEESGEFYKCGTRKTLLSPDEENKLALFVQTLAARGFGLSTDCVVDLLNSFADNCNEDVECRHRVICAKESPVFTRKYVYNFRKRHPELSFRKTSSLDSQRAMAATEETRHKFFSMVEKQVEELYLESLIPYESVEQIPPCSIFNMDDAGIDVTAGSARNKRNETSLLRLSKRKWSYDLPCDSCNINESRWKRMVSLSYSFRES